MANMIDEKVVDDNTTVSTADSLSEASIEVKDKTLTESSEAKTNNAENVRYWCIIVLKVVYVCGLLYSFLFGLDLMGTSFKLLGGRAAGDIFTDIDNPIAGLMVGILATVLVQSSSTSTSIVVSMVGADIMSVRNAIPVIMGANIGTSVTNTLVALTHIKNVDEFEAAFSGSTVHDFFNFLSVLVLLPIELSTGLLRFLSRELTIAFTGESGTEWEGPIKKIVSPLTKKLLQVDKGKIKSIAKGKDVEGSLIKGGAFQDSGLSDNAVGIICLIMSLIILCVALILLVKFLRKTLQTRIGDWLRRSLNVHGVVSILIGCGITIIVQSSSVTTSSLVPLVAVGTIDLEHLFPLTLGANIGTTVTALLASLTQNSANALQIALVHLCFNIFGILIWYPIPAMRNIPIKLARKLGQEVRNRRYLSIVYIGVTFFIIPLNLIGFSEGEPWLLYFGLFLNVAIIASFFGAVWIRRNRPHLIPCVALRPSGGDDDNGGKHSSTMDIKLTPRNSVTDISLSSDII